MVYENNVRGAAFIILLMLSMLLGGGMGELASGYESELSVGVDSGKLISVNDRARWYSSPDISSIIQEIVDRPNWTSGNALAILSYAENGEDRKDIRAYDYDVFSGVKLEITYSITQPK